MAHNTPTSFATIPLPSVYRTISLIESSTPPGSSSSAHRETVVLITIQPHSARYQGSAVARGIDHPPSTSPLVDIRSDPSTKNFGHKKEKNTSPKPIRPSFSVVALPTFQKRSPLQFSLVPFSGASNSQFPVQPRARFPHPLSPKGNLLLD